MHEIKAFFFRHLRHLSVQTFVSSDACLFKHLSLETLVCSDACLKWEWVR